MKCITTLLSLGLLLLLSSCNRKVNPITQAEEEPPPADQGHVLGEAKPSEEPAPPQPDLPDIEIINFFDTGIDITEYRGQETIKNISALNDSNSKGKIIPWFGFGKSSDVKNKELDHPDSNGCGVFSNYFKDDSHPEIPWTKEMYKFYAKNIDKEGDSYSSENLPKTKDGHTVNPISCVENFFQLYKCLESPCGNKEGQQSPFLQKAYSGGVYNFTIGGSRMQTKGVIHAINKLIDGTADQSKDFASSFAGNPLDRYLGRDEAMFRALLAKFPNDKEHSYTKTLLSTCNAILVEGNNWQDDRWGAVVASESPLKYKKGAESKLGKMLMLIRYIRSRDMSDTDKFVQDAIKNHVWQNRNLEELLDPKFLQG